jgi:thiol-disulfide isomerase/thioredoxin
MAKVPRTNLKDLRKRLAQQRGKVVLLNFWATWCGPCVKEFPDIVKLYNNYRKKGLTVIAVSVDDPETADEVVPPLYQADARDLPRAGAERG